MKILYGIQGTGHGHISRAREIVPLLADEAEIDVLISGYNCKMTLENAAVIQKRGISLTYDSKGSVSYLKTALNIHPVSFLQDVSSLAVRDYDLIISDYEPITAWASIHSEIPSIALSHQAAFLSPRSPRPEKTSHMAEQVLKHFAPCKEQIGFHFRRYDSFILPPVIRKDVRELETSTGDHVTVYLPAFDHGTLVSIFNQFSNTRWHIFSPSCDSTFRKENVEVYPVGNSPFLESMKDSSGVITSAGFETCAEAMYLGKKLLVIPIQNQYEQLCNAAALSKLGIQTILKMDRNVNLKIGYWLENAPVVHLPEAADMKQLTSKLIRFAEKITTGDRQAVAV